MGNGKYFYCYSCKLMHFLKSYGFWYLSKGLNRQCNYYMEYNKIQVKGEPK